jgi:hypothetical protein
MGARHRRQEEGTPSHYDLSGTAWASGGGVGVAVEERRVRRAGRKSRRRRLARILINLDKGDNNGYNWVWKRGWNLDKKKGERLVYIMKTRYISMAVLSLGFRLTNMISSRSMIFMLAITAGAVGWAAEYVKHRLGSQGISITLGIRLTRWVLTPWLDATPYSHDNA